jgi:hypothetical protein
MRGQFSKITCFHQEKSRSQASPVGGVEVSCFLQEAMPAIHISNGRNPFFIGAVYGKIVTKI